MIQKEEPRYDSVVFGKTGKECIDFIKKCLTKDQKNRPKAVELLNHPWMQKNNLKNQVCYRINESEEKSMLGHIKQFADAKKMQQILVTQMVHMNID